jgi:drug/metabolite transporter (DMT)-like permease
LTEDAMPPGRFTFALAATAMIFFAANSVLNRLGLAAQDAGAWTFTAIRIGSGALVLLLLMRGRGWRDGTWPGAAALLAYAAFFSYAYLALNAGTGALILFAVVQFTMVGWGLIRGERLSLLQVGGIAVAFGALVWLLSPGLNAPPLAAGLSMAAAGAAWGVYSLIGRGARSPAAATAGNFARALAIVAVATPLVLFVSPEAPPTTNGVLAAAVSGGLASAVGYIIWYAALPRLSPSQAGVMQLTVPAIAAFGGILFLGETLTTRLIIATLAILAGVGLAVLAPRPRARAAEKS